MESLRTKRLRVTFSQDLESSLSKSRTYIVEEFKEPLEYVPNSISQLLAVERGRADSKVRDPAGSLSIGVIPRSIEELSSVESASITPGVSTATGSSAALDSTTSLVLGRSGGSGGSFAHGSGSLSAASSSSIDLYGIRSPKRTAKPILKLRESFAEEDTFSLHKLQEAKALKFVRSGTQLLKWTRSSQGRKVKRFARVTEDGSTLEIVSRFRITKVELADVERVTLGPRSLAFSKFDWKNESPWRCFSIMTRHRTWDFQCCTGQEDNVALLWFLGLQSLSPMNQFYMTWGKILWTKAHLRAMQVAEKKGISVVVVWKNMARIATNPRLRKSLWHSIDDCSEI